MTAIFTIEKTANPSYPPFTKGGTFSDHSQADSPLFKGGLGGILNPFNHIKLNR